MGFLDFCRLFFFSALLVGNHVFFRTRLTALSRLSSKKVWLLCSREHCLTFSEVLVVLWYLQSTMKSRNISNSTVCFKWSAHIDWLFGWESKKFSRIAYCVLFILLCRVFLLVAIWSAEPKVCVYLDLRIGWKSIKWSKRPLCFLFCWRNLLFTRRGLGVLNELFGAQVCRSDAPWSCPPGFWLRGIRHALYEVLFRKALSRSL